MVHDEIPSPKYPALTMHCTVSTLDPPEQGLLVMAFEQHVLQGVHADSPARHRQSNQSSMHAISFRLPSLSHVLSLNEALWPHDKRDTRLLHKQRSTLLHVMGHFTYDAFTIGCGVVSRRTVGAHGCTCTQIGMRDHPYTYRKPNVVCGTHPNPAFGGTAVLHDTGAP